MSRQYFNKVIESMSNEEIVNTIPLREFACNFVYGEHKSCLNRNCKECILNFLQNDELETFMKKALGIDEYTYCNQDWLNEQLDFAREYEKELLSFEYMVLSIDNYYDAFVDHPDDYLIAKNDEIVIYKNIYNVRFTL